MWVGALLAVPDPAFAPPTQNLVYKGAGIAHNDVNAVAPSSSGTDSNSTIISPSDVITDELGSVLWTDAASKTVQILPAGSDGAAVYGLNNVSPMNSYVLVGGGATPADITGVPRTEVNLAGATGLAIDGDGNLLIMSKTQLVVLAVDASQPVYVDPAATWQVGEVFPVGSSEPVPVTSLGVDVTTADLGGDAIAVDSIGNIAVVDALGRINIIAVTMNDPGYLANNGVNWTPGNVYTIVGDADEGVSDNYVSTPRSALGAYLDANNVAFDQFNNLIVSDIANHTVAVVAVAASNAHVYPTTNGSWTVGNIFKIAGTPGVTPDYLDFPSELGAPAMNVVIEPGDVTFDEYGNIVMSADGGDVYVIATTAARSPLVRDVTWTHGYIYRVVGWNHQDAYTPSNLSPTPALTTNLFEPTGVAYMPKGGLVVSGATDGFGHISVTMTPPSAPRNPVASVGETSGTVSVAFDEPLLNGGFGMVTYTVVSTPGGFSQSGSSSPIVVSGLQDGQNYTFKVYASNIAGAGPESSASNGVTPVAPVTQPSPPLNVDVTSKPASLEVKWDAPVSDGGSAVTGYLVEFSSDNEQTWTTAFEDAASSPVTIPNLFNGTSYVVRVSAKNAQYTGTGATDAATPADVPGQVQNAVATPGSTNVKLTWIHPASDGGAEIGSYEVDYSDDGGDTWTSASTDATSPYEVENLTNNQAYKFRILARNSAGPGTPVILDATPVPPVSAPTAPTSVSVVPSTNQAVVTYAPPSSDGGSAVVGYAFEYRVVGTESWTAVQGVIASPRAITGLTPATQYEFRLAAINTKGTGAHATGNFTTLANMPTPGITAPVHITPEGNIVTVPVYTPPTPITEPLIVAATPTGGGSWALTPDGGVFTAGDAPFLGSMGGTPLNAPMTGIAPTSTGEGYYLVGTDGGVFTYGDAGFQGSMGGTSLNAPVTSLAPTCSNNGYYLVADDGGVFAFGDALFHGSMAGVPLNAGMAGIVPACDASSYWTWANDGGVFTFGNAQFYGSLASNPPTGGVIGMVAAPDGLGYWLIGGDNKAYGFGSVAD